MTKKAKSNILTLPILKACVSGPRANSDVIGYDQTGNDAFKEMADNALQGIIVQRNLQPLYINRVWAQLFGLTVDEVMALPCLSELFYQADRERLWRYSLDRLAGRDAPDRYRYRINHKSGRTIWVEGFVRLIDWHGQEACQSTVVNVDDQEQQAAELLRLQMSLEAQVRDRTTALDASKRQLHLYEAIINQMSDRISVIGTDYRFRLTNQANLDFCKRSLDELIGRHLRAEIGDSWFESSAKPMLDKAFAGETAGDDRVIEHPDIGLRHIDLRAQPFREPDGTISGAIVSIRDVTEAKRAGEQLRLFMSAVEQVSDRISVIGTDYHYRLTNKANRDFYRKPLEAFSGRHLRDIVGEDVFIDFNKPALDRCFAGETMKLQRPSHEFDRVPCMLDIHFEPYREGDGRISGAVVTLRDVTEAHHLSERLAYQANHDVLTGLANRQTFERHLQKAISETASTFKSAAFCFIDLDQFKVINDTVGHLVGDQLLQQVARLLSNKVHEGDVLARLGGDEFGLLLRGCSLRRAERAAEKLVAVLNDYRFYHDGHVFEIGASIGITVINRATHSISEVMSQADLACYAAKDHGRNRIHIFKKSDAFLSRRQEEMHQAGGIRAALDQNRFTLFAQPIKAVSHDRSLPDRIEILLRMTDEDDELIMPSCFIPAAERYGFMGEIDRWVIKNTVGHLAQVLTSDADLRVNINLSGATLNDDSLLDFVRRTLREAKVSAHRVCFEITETAAIRNLVKTEAFIQDLRASGCKFALDDFGSGLSSLNYLKRLPVDYLKIDRTFVRDVRSDITSRAMVSAIHQMAKALGIETVAEGIEDRITLSVLKELGIEFVQGFEVGKPEPLTCFAGSTVAGASARSRQPRASSI